MSTRRAIRSEPARAYVPFGQPGTLLTPGYVRLDLNADHQPLLGHRDSHVLQRSRSAPFPRPLRRASRDGRLETGDLLDGDLPPRAERLVKEWAALNRAELGDDWRLAQGLQPLRPIEPLP